MTIYYTRYGRAKYFCDKDEVAEKLYHQELTRENLIHPSVCWRHHRQYDAQLPVLADDRSWRYWA